MKKIISSVLFLLMFFISMAQTEVQPAASPQEASGTSAGVKIALAIGAIIIMSLIFYLAKNFNKRK